MTFRSKLGDNFSRDEKNKFKNKGFSLIPTKSELTGKDDKLARFRDRYMTSIAKRLYAEGKLPMEEDTFVKTITNLESMHFLREMTWIYQFITREATRKWNAIPIGFQIYELGLETSPDKSEPMDYKELLKKFTYGLTTVGPSFTMEEKKNYLESTGKKLNYLCPIFALAMVDNLIKEVPQKELAWFFDLIGVKVMNFLSHPKKFFPKKKIEKKVEQKKEIPAPKTKKEKKWVNKFDKEKAEAEAKAEAEQVESVPTETSKVNIPETKVETAQVELDADGKEIHYAPTEAELTAEKEAIEAAAKASANAEASEESPNK
jgi:hypothetical protein